MAHQCELTYFLKCHEFVKIGKTTGLKMRVDELQVGNPYDLEIIGVTFRAEDDLQYKFEHLKHKKEWFHLTTELKEYIAEHAACPDAEGNYEELEPRDFDVINVGKSKVVSERIKSVQDIIRELEREAGSAHIDTIIERAAKFGIDKDKVEAEIVHLVQEARIFEPVRYSRNYRFTQQ
jgi:hypothetical protein